MTVDSHTKGKHGLRMFESGELRRIFGPNRDKVTRGWRNLHEEIQYSYSSIIIIKMVK
jgi:hypothetical protein